MFFISALIALAPVPASLPSPQADEPFRSRPAPSPSAKAPAAARPDLCLPADGKTPADKYDYAACNAGDRLSADRWMLQAPAEEDAADPR